MPSIQQAFRQELCRLSRQDGRRPYGLTLIPWHPGRVPDSRCGTWQLVASLAGLACWQGGGRMWLGGAEMAADGWLDKYSTLVSNWVVLPVAAENLGVLANPSWIFWPSCRVVDCAVSLQMRDRVISVSAVFVAIQFCCTIILSTTIRTILLLTLINPHVRGH